MAKQEENQYIYAVTRVHINEQNLLSRQDVEQLITAPSAAEVFRTLTDKGWGTPNTAQNDTEALMNAELEKTWALIEELTEDLSVFNVFRYSNDFHNLKAAIKLAYSANDEVDKDRYFMNYGTIDIEIIKKAAKSHDFTSLPAEMALAGREAYEALAHTSSGQACDIVIDRAALIAIYEAGGKSESEVLRRYAEITVDAANIKAAVRCCLMKKSNDFIRRTIAQAGTLDIPELIKAAASSREDIYAYISKTQYHSAVEALETSMAAFECWCDNQMMEMIRPQRRNYFGIEPLAAFILGRENEIRMVRLVLSAKINNLSSEMLRERLRESYV